MDWRAKVAPSDQVPDRRPLRVRWPNSTDRMVQQEPLRGRGEARTTTSDLVSARRW
jgi:hypothetical protein